jgi:glycosyltransferase involved in cell wall biosynthesis
LGKKAIYWGHGRDLLNQSSKIKNFAYFLEHWICDAIILYAEHIKKYVPKRFHNKVFIANNTLCITEHYHSCLSKELILEKYNVNTKKNIIYVGRIQKRRRLEDLFMAFELINNQDIGLILVGSDDDGILQELSGNNVYKLGPIYGKDKFALLSAADVYCLPGAVGLSIVDAFYCGLPIVTEEVDESPEIMYLKDGVNGFVVPKGDIRQLAEKLYQLLENDRLREEFSMSAKNEIMSRGHINVMCKGFTEALLFCDRKND